MYRLQRTRISTSFVVATLLMGFLAVRAYLLPGEQAEEGQWVLHTHQVLHQIEMLSGHLSEAENNQRGFLLTGREEYMLPYEQAVKRIDGDLAQFEYLTRDNESQQAQLPRLHERLARQMGVLRRTIEGSENAGREKNPVLENTRGTELIREQIDEMRAEEYRLLEVRLDRWKSSVARTGWVFLSTVGALYVLVCLIYVIGRKESVNRSQLLAAEQAQSKRLLEIVDIQRDIATHRLEPNAAMQKICERTQVLTQADGAIVEMLEDREMVYRAASGSGAPHIGVRIPMEGSLSGLAITENRVLICDDADTDERVDRAACLRVGLRSMVVVPLRHNGRAIGVLKVLSSTPCVFREHHVATLELMAATLSATLNDALAAAAVRAANQLLLQANSELEGLATTDGLTGLKNHRTFQERLADEFQRSLRHKTPLSLVLIDVDHFKTYNDSFGHPAGDSVLKRVAALLQESGRATDCVARYGGEEFALLLPATPAEGATIIAERIRARIADTAWEQRAITVSVGISSYNPAMESAAQLLKLSDTALYQSKTMGRNRVTHAQEMNFS